MFPAEVPKLLFLSVPIRFISYLPKQLHNIVEIDPPVPVEIKRTDRLIRRNPLHLVEHEHDIVEVLAVVGVQVFVEAITIGISGGVGEAGKWI